MSNVPSQIYQTREFDIRTGIEAEYQILLHPGQIIEDIIVEVAEAQLPPDHPEYDEDFPSIFVLVRGASAWEIATMRNTDTCDDDLRGLRLFNELEERYMTFIETDENGFHHSLQEAQDRLHEVAHRPELYPALFP